MASKVSGRSVESPKINDPRTWTPCSLEDLQPLDQIFAEQIEILVDRLEAFGRNRLDAHQRPSNACLAHRVQELGILRRFHGDLREESKILGQFGQPRHQLKPFGANGLQLRELLVIPLPLGVFQIGERHGIKIVVGQRDETKTEAPQFHRFFDHAIG